MGLKNIYKHNPVINGHFVEGTHERLHKLTRKDVPLPLSEFEWDCLNAIYGIVQQRLWDIDPSEYASHSMQYFSYTAIADVLGYKSNQYIDKINSTIDKMYAADLILRNFINPVDGKKYKTFRTRLIQSDGTIERDESGNSFMINFSDFFMVCMMRHTANFTIIGLQEGRDIKGKYAKPIYERLKSKQSLCPSLLLKLKELNEMFCVEESSLRRHKERMKRIVAQNPDTFIMNEYPDGIEVSLIAEENKNGK